MWYVTGQNSIVMQARRISVWQRSNSGVHIASEEGNFEEIKRVWKAEDKTASMRKWISRLYDSEGIDIALMA